MKRKTRGCKTTAFLVPLFISALLLFLCAMTESAGNAAGDGPDASKTFKLTSTAFQDKGKIPPKYACGHENISPPLAWSNAPKGTAAFALTVIDPDAPGGDFIHWGMIDIPESSSSLAENVSPGGQLPQGAWETKNDFSRTGYGGPCPPAGTHHYRFTLYALSEKIAKPSGTPALGDLLSAIQSKAIQSTVLTGIYQR